MFNRTLIRSILKKIPYELYKGKKSNILYFKIFGCLYFILINGKNNLKKFDAKYDEGIFLRYSSYNKAYRVFNRRILVIKESIYAMFDKTNIFKSREVDVDDDPGFLKKEIKYKKNRKKVKDGFKSES